MRPVRVTTTGVAASAPIVLDYLIAPFQVTIGAKVTGAATFTVEHTLDDPFAPGFDPATALWFPHPDLTAKAANAYGIYTYPVRAIRINQTAGAGSVEANVVQAGVV